MVLREMDVTALDTLNISSSTTTSSSSTSGIDNSSPETLRLVESGSFFYPAFTIDADINLEDQIDSVATAFSVANQGVAFSQATNMALYYQNDMLENIKNKLNVAKKDTTSATGLEVIREEIVDILTKFDKVASNGKYNDLYYLQKSNSDNSASLVYTFQISEYPDITISNESIKSPYS